MQQQLIPRSIATLFLSLLISQGLLWSQPKQDVTQISSGSPYSAVAQSSISFARNLGQWPDQVRFAARLKGLDLWVTDSSILYDLHTITSLSEYPAHPAPDPARERAEERSLRRGHLLRMSFAGASADAGTEGITRMPGYYNYYIGNDPSRWAANVPLYQDARIRNLYPGISLLLQFDDGLPRYDFHVAPDADPARIRMRFDGAGRISITSSGELAIATSLGVVRQQKLFAYQMTGGRKQQVACSFRVHEDGSVGFQLGRYDRSLPLVIDPILYSTLLGGSGNDNAISVASDFQGNACITGYAGAPTPLATTFPTTSGAYQRVEQGNSDVFVAKVSANGTFMFATIVGGKGFEDGRDIAVDGSGDIYVTGFTNSTDFPITAGAYNQTANGGSHDAFILKFAANGSSLMYSTYVGGSHSDAAYSINVDVSGTARICGSTASNNFPTTPDAYDRTFNGETDIFCFALSPSGSDMVSATYIGGSAVDYPSSIERDVSGRMYIAGTTSSPDFPVTATAAGKQLKGDFDAAVMRLDAGNTRLEYATYIGGSGEDRMQDLGVDGTGTITVCGYTSSANFPIAGVAVEPKFSGGDYDGFVTRITTSGSINYSTYIGGRNDDYATAVGLYNSRCWIAGYTSTPEFPYTTAGYDTSFNGRHDGYVLLIDLVTDTIYYSTFIGGVDRDVINDILVDQRVTPRAMYICGTTISEDFPASMNAYQRNLTYKYHGDQGDRPFTYDAFYVRLQPATIFLMTQTPDNRVLICPGGTFRIVWGSFEGGLISIDLMDESGRRFAYVMYNNGPSDPAHWEWNVPTNQAPGTKFRIRITQLTGSLGDTGNVDFTIIEEPKLLRGISSTDICPGTKLQFSAEATGYQISYRWRKDGFTVFGADGPSYAVDSVTAADTGVYELAVIDACGSVALSRTATVRFKAMPAITGQPQDSRFCIGSTGTLSVGATGDHLLYRWLKDGVPVPGGTSAVLAINPVTLADDGFYTCEVRSQDCPDSPNPTQRVRVTAVYETIAEPPKNQSVAAGGSVGFYVAAAGHDPTYQWRKDGRDIPGANLSTLSLKRVTVADAGLYDVVVNGECQVISPPARLTVTTFSAVTGGMMDQAASLIVVHPNPVTSRGTIRIAADAAELRGAELALYDMLGRKVLDLTANLHAGNGESVEFDANGLPAGTYYCRLSGNGRTGTDMVVIEK